MTTNDNFTDAAAWQAEEELEAYLGTEEAAYGFRDGFARGAEWARTHLAAAVLPLIAAEVRKGQVEALRETADWWAATPDDDVFETDGDTRNWLRDVATEYETGDRA